MGKFQPLTITKEQLDALDDEHDDVLVMRGHPELAPWIVVLRRPTAEEAHAFKAMADDKQKKLHANTKLISRLAVFPTGADWERQYSRWPMLADGISASEEFQAFCGLEGHFEARAKR